MKVWAERNKSCVAICDCDPFSSNTGTSQIAKDSQTDPNIYSGSCTCAEI